MTDTDDKASEIKDKEQVIRQVYYDVESGYGSIQQTYRDSKKLLNTITLQNVKDFLEKQSIRQTKRPRKWNSYVAEAPLQEFQIDLADYSRSAEYNDGYAYALCCIDIFTKYAYCIPLKTKQRKEVAEGFKEILNHMGICSVLMTDFEGSFVSNEFKHVLKIAKIKHVISSNPPPFIERFIGTFKHMIHMRLKGSGLEKGWVQLVPTVLKRYNSLPHSTTSISPNDAKKKDNELLVKFNIMNKAKFARKYPPLSVGQMVRKYRKPDNFSGKKASVSRWSEKPYKITNIKDGLYYLDDGIARGYLRHDLLKIEGDETKDG
jgi:hypothetical protein